MKAWLAALFGLLPVTCVLALGGQEEYNTRLHAAGVVDQQGDYAGAEKMLLVLLKDAANFGPDDPRKGIVLHRLGSVYHSEGRYLEAEAYYKKAIEVWKSAPELGDVPLVQSTRDLAALYVETGQYHKAERLGLDPLAARLEATMPDSVAFAGLTGTLGALAFAQGRYGAAETYYQRALALWEKLAPNTLERMQILEDMGLLCQHAARYAEALNWYERALSVAQAVLGSAHPEEVKLLANIGALQFTTHGPLEAIPFYKSALAIGERALGPEHPVVGEVLLNYALVLRQAKRKGEARICQRRAETILNAAAGTRNYTIDIGDVQRRPTAGIHH